MKLREFRLADDYSYFFLSGGVCAGVAYAIGMRVWLVRMFWFVLAIISGALLGYFNAAVIIYILFWMFVPDWPRTPEDFEEVTGSG